MAVDFAELVSKTAGMENRVSTGSSLCGCAVGVGAALLADGLISRRSPHRDVLWAAIGLMTAALVYPLARRRVGLDRAEAWAVLSAGAIASVSIARPGRSSRLLLGLGWICHALFDAACGHNSSTWRLPRWYPAFCAGFDIAYGARLVRTA